MTTYRQCQLIHGLFKMETMNDDSLWGLFFPTSSFAIDDPSPRGSSCERECYYSNVISRQLTSVEIQRIYFFLFNAWTRAQPNSDIHVY